MPRVELTPDELEAVLWLEPDERIDEATALGLLVQSGVSFGLLQPALAGLEGTVGPARVVIAQGLPPVPPQDASIHFAFRAGRQDLRPVIQADGRADFRNLGLVVNVQPGQELARRVPPVEGQAGRTVTGREIRPLPPRDQVLVAGEGAQVTPDGLAIVATVAGNPALERRRVRVRQEYVVPGDVSLATGNVSFEGDLTIRGTIQLQMEVRATGSVQVFGGVEGGRVIAGGSITIEGGVRQQSQLEAGDDVVAKFVENSTIRCGGSLGLQEDLINGQVLAGRAIVVGGTVVGGEVRVAERLEARALGARFGTPTLVAVVPVAPEAADDDLRALREERASIQENLAKIAPRVREAHDALVATNRSGPDPAVFRKVLELAAQLHARDTALAEREADFVPREPATRPRLAVREVIHPGVHVQLGVAVMRIKDAYPAGTLIEERGEIRLVPL